MTIGYYKKSLHQHENQERLNSSRVVADGIFADRILARGSAGNPIVPGV